MPQPGSPARRVNLRMIAAQAGVSLTTVSFALRHNPRIPAPTREHVLRVAERLGYRPDPEIAKLMHHLRARQAPGFQSTLCALTTVPQDSELSYLQHVMNSARQRADALGYRLTFMRVDHEAESRHDLQRVLLSRGIEGVLLLPLLRPRSVVNLLDWSKFAVVAATNGVLAPEFHRVVPHQFSNMLTMCRELTSRGYRRIGMVEPAQHDLTVNQSFSAAVMWQSFFGGTERVMPLVYHGPRPENLRSWFKQEQPDAIITIGEAEARWVASELGLKIPGPIGFATANKSGSSFFAGMEERPADIGTTAVRLLAGLIQHGEKGIPAVPTVTMVRGQWCEGRSVRSAATPRGRAPNRSKRG